MYYIIIYQIMYIHSMPCSTLRGGGGNVIKCQFTLTFKSFRYSWNTIFYHIDIPKFWKMQMVFHLWGCIRVNLQTETQASAANRCVPAQGTVWRSRLCLLLLERSAVHETVPLDPTLYLEPSMHPPVAF